MNTTTLAPYIPSWRTGFYGACDKKYYAPGAPLFVGLITLAIVTCISPDPLITGKKATHLAALDVVQTFTNLLQTRTAGLGLSVKPLQMIRSPYIVMTLGLALSLILNVFIPSAAGLGLLLMVSLYPVMISAGISRQAAAATILIGGCCFGPSGANNLLAADLTKMHVMDFFLNVQWVIGWAVVPVMPIANYFAQKWFDKKDLAAGRITQTDFEAQVTQAAGDKAGHDDAPAFYALFPLVPVVLLFVFSPLMYKGIRMEVVTALLTSAFVAFLIDLIRTRKLKDCIGGLKNYAQGMGKVFTSTVFLIVSAEVFTAGLMKSGGIATIIQSVTAMDSGAVAVFTVMFLIVVGSAFVTGSGNAAFFSFAPMIPDAAAAVGAQAAFMMSPLQLVSGMARSSSPVAGVAIAIAGLTGLEPFQLVRRTIPVMALSILTTYLRSLMLI